MSFSRFLPLLIAALAVSTVASARISEGEPVGSATRGAAVIQGNCDACHAVGASGTSPNPDAPPFREVARRYQDQRLDWELEAISEVGHYRMPKRVLTAGEIADVLTYIRSLQPQQEERKGRTRR